MTVRAEPIAPVRASYLSRSRGVAWVVDALVVGVTPCLLIAWVARDKLLDIQLSNRT